jgi:hypothetical protein
VCSRFVGVFCQWSIPEGQIRDFCLFGQKHSFPWFILGFQHRCDNAGIFRWKKYSPSMVSVPNAENIRWNIHQ